ncbi:MAG: hypothetical protein AAFX09_10095 [Pseudomonadota bacterium]
MYVCICNALRSRDFKSAAQSGARDAVSAFKACNARPRCGRCLEEAERTVAGAAPVGAVTA